MTVGDPHPSGAQNRDTADDDRPSGDAGADLPTVSGNGASSLSQGFPGNQHSSYANDRRRPETPALRDLSPAPVDSAARKPRRSRSRATLISTLLGIVLVSAGLYLIGGFGARLYDAATNSWIASTSDLVLATTGALCLFAAVLLNGWSPWATALPGVILTAVGVWSVVSVDGARRVAAFVDNAVGRGNLVLSGVHLLVLVIGLLLLAASGAVMIARSAGRSRGRS